MTKKEIADHIRKNGICKFDLNPVFGKFTPFQVKARKNLGSMLGESHIVPCNCFGDIGWTFTQQGANHYFPDLWRDSVHSKHWEGR